MSKLILAYFLAIACTLTMAYMFPEENAKKIRESKFWFLGCLVWLFCCAQGFEAYAYLWDYYQLPETDEDVAVPVFFGVVLFLLFVVYIWNVYLPSRRLKKELKRFDKYVDSL